ncbi:transcriptional regulator, TetR family protein [Vibrio mediterranei AK1]|uniref:TetR/AcrR family transcriptional regulator n=1 Tax=Vibrio mediterranei TaxID=689 RepID=UPI00015401C2|nr:TetR/AcrR family transcriptional regulator [Vibrio mediterranei]EDL55950.1 transcriptional regulator, TetR family protein [Vibrio mediterranei AK1]
MAKPAKFNRSEVIHKAMLLYWEKGFHATSMRCLQDAIDMRPGSIYAEFGSKEGLFKAAIEHYSTQGQARLDDLVKQFSSPLQGLKAFILQSVQPCSVDNPNAMCMLAKTVAELTEENEELLELARYSLRKNEAKFAEIIAEAQSLGEVNQELSPMRLAQHLQIQIMGIKTYIHATDCSQAQTRVLVEELFSGYMFRVK